jgi:hypothetical protein
MVFKSVVTIGSEAVPPGAETVEQCAEQHPVCITRRTTLIASVPQSVPQGTPRKPLQGLAVPQFHDFRRIGEKNTENRSAHIPGKRAPARSPTSPVCASTGVGRHGSADGEGIAHKARVAPRVRSGAEGARRGMERGSEGGKTPVFLPDSGRFPPDLFQSRNKRCRHISPQQRTEGAKNRFVRQVWRLM